MTVIPFYLTVRSSTVNPTTNIKALPASTNAPAEKTTAPMISEVKGRGKTDPHSTGGGSNAGLIGGVTSGVILLILAVVIITVFLIRCDLIMKGKNEMMKKQSKIILIDVQSCIYENTCRRHRRDNNEQSVKYSSGAGKIMLSHSICLKQNYYIYSHHALSVIALIL